MLVEVTPPEPQGHVVHERTIAENEQRSCRNMYKEVPLTGRQQSMLPTYRLPQSFGRIEMLDEHDLCDISSSVRHTPHTETPWIEEEDEQIARFRLPDGLEASPEDLRQDALLAFFL